MLYFRKRLRLRKSDTILVTCNIPCIIYLMTDGNFNKFKNGKPCHRHAGGLCNSFPVRLKPPSTGNWSIVITAGIDFLKLRHTITVEPARPLEPGAY
ncbi:TPA: DUF1883 domain-containing protein [Salmonella enterica]|nr:DUF1883 domain-containing protein [Salmonella enterica]